MADDSDHLGRYQRQVLLPQIRAAGQARLGSARVLLVGCGALGCVIADQLVRAGMGFLRLADRDVVELTNLQRQTLFDESNARQGLPKAVAAANRLSAVNSAVMIEPVPTDVFAGNIEELAGLGGGGRRVDLILDGTDNVATRYLINDLSVKHGVPWVYGACVGTEGRVMTIRPPATACLRCVYRDPPRPEELPTCDTAGVLGPAAGVVGSLQAAAALRLLASPEEATPASLLAIDVWRGTFRSISTEGADRADCPCCGKRNFEFLCSEAGQAVTTLCGRNAVQVRAARGKAAVNLVAIAEKLSAVGDVQRGKYFVRCQVSQMEGVALTVFPDGRVLVQGMNDVARAKAVCARFVGG